MSRKHQEIILENVTIEAVAAEGKALAHVDGAVIFVQFAVPGDIVDIKVTKKKKNYYIIKTFTVLIVTSLHMSAFL